MSTKIKKATKKNISEAGYLFDLYRQFYKYKSNIKASTNYIKDRIFSFEAMFIKALRIIGELISYHNEQSKEKHWENITQLLKQLNISAKNPKFKALKEFYMNKNKLN